MNFSSLVRFVIAVIVASSVIYAVAAQESEEADTESGTNEISPAAGDVSYIVQPGDVLDLIGAGFNVSAACIAQTNELPNPNRIFPGDELIIRASCPPYDGFALDGGATASVEAGTQAAQSDAGQGGGGEPGPGDQTYVIQPGDTLDGIAQEFNISLISLQQVNDLFDFRDVVPGLTIVIPGDAPPYGVVPPMQDIGTERPVNIGQGGGGQGGGSTASASASGSQTMEGNIYTVQDGDTILTVAAQFGVTPSQLTAVNELFSQIELEAGTQLVIP